MSSRLVLMNVGEDGVAVLTINNPPVNSLSTAVFNDLYRRFEQVQAHDDIKAVVLTGANKQFSGGADIKDFQRQQNSGEEDEKPILRKIDIVNQIVEGSKKPIVAAIDGFALGGGLELAMACHARIATQRARLGLPELQLGIIPGLGGTQRLPRLVGLSMAIDMLLNSRIVGAKEARETGLIDTVAIDSYEMVALSRTRALELRNVDTKHFISLHRMDWLGDKDEALKVLQNARASARRKFRNVSYPFLCLDVVEEGLLQGGESGTLMENGIARSLVKSVEARALMHFFFAQRAALKVPGLTDLGLNPRPIKKVAVVGAGWMGTGIATALVLSNISVILKDLSSLYLEESFEQIKENLQNLVMKGKMTKLQADRSLSLVKLTYDYTEFNEVDLVIESVSEDVSLKQRIFNELSSFCSQQCILVSNTSSIDIATLGASVTHPERVAGLHFFSPAHVMQLLEVARTRDTSMQVLVDLLAFAKRLRKIPLVVKSSFGFAANCMFVPYCMISCFLVDLGVDPYYIDDVVKDFGFPMGPFRVLDLTGIKTFQLVSQLWHDNFPGRFHRSALPGLLLRNNRTGSTTKKGFYNYRESGEVMRTGELNEYLQSSRKIAQLENFQELALNITGGEVVEMILFPVVNETCRILEEQTVTQPAALDIASILGMGFPSYRGGIIFWADNLGLRYILTKMKKWCLLYGDVYKPCDLLEKLATSNTQLGQYSAKLFSSL